MSPIPLALFAALLIGLALPAQAADRPVRLDVPPDLAADLSAMPRIADPVDEAEGRINSAVRRLDASALKAARECRRGNAGRSSWSRSIDTSMRGPGFLSYVVTDDVFCGGAHPNTSTMAIVYDLASGAPVDWTKLLPSSLTGTVALQQGADGTRTVSLASKRLFALYLQGYRPKAGKPESEDDRTCREAVSETFDGNPPAMSVWLDAKAGGLTAQFDLVHVVQACADPVTIPAATLRKEGAQPVLVDAIEAAHGAR